MTPYAQPSESPPADRNKSYAVAKSQNPPHSQSRGSQNDASTNHAPSTRNREQPRQSVQGNAPKPNPNTNNTHGGTVEKTKSYSQVVGNASPRDDTQRQRSSTVSHHGSQGQPGRSGYEQGDPRAVNPSSRTGSMPDHVRSGRADIPGSHGTKEPELMGAISGILSGLDDLHRAEIGNLNTYFTQRENHQGHLRHYCELLEREYQSNLRHLQKVVDERNQLREEARAMHTEISNMRRRLEEIGKNRRDPVPFANLADGVSGADLVQDIQLLNGEIYQFAACLADNFKKLPDRHTSDIKKDLKSMFGPAITNFVLQAVRQGVHSWILQAVQTCTIACCADVLTAPLIPSLKNIDDLEDIYLNIRKREGQGVSGRWRSLLCRNGSWDTAEQGVCNDIKGKIKYVCSVLGLEMVKSIHGDTLDSIASKTLHLLKAMCVDVVSGDMEVIFPEPGALYDPDTMELSDGRDVSPTGLPRGKPIFCTTDMGLRKLVGKREYSKSQEQWMFQEDSTTILKAKVSEPPS
ncbi:hypothetical protein AX15_002044 [Amanita polypyramis BW_CC]|nr:hypothetical protein AX15_002044 [Amanita polypyramis BW_CC]